MKIKLASHLSGTIVPIEKVNDEVFSAKILGDGIAVEPREGKLYAPCDAKVDKIIDTNHAVNLITDDGMEILLHIGIDTVELGGKYFTPNVKNGEVVKKGDILIEFDVDKIVKEGYKVTTPMIICNSDNYKNISAVASGEVKAGDLILSVE